VTGKTFYIETFGCQMNVHDSEKVIGTLLEKGYAQVAKPEEAELVLYNTCSIRDKAEQKVFSRLQQFKREAGKGKTFGVLGCVPLLVYGPEVYQQWFALLATERDRAALTTNASFLGLSLRLGSALPGTLLSVALLGASAFWAWRYRPMALRVSALALVVGILASPLGWIHYTLFLLPVFFWGPKSLPMCLAAALLILPADRIVRLFNAPIWLMVSVGSAYNWAVLLCLIGLLRRQVATDDQALPPIAVTTD